MKHIMLDLETLGTRPDAAIVAIGAVEFDPRTQELGKQFYNQIDITSSLASGSSIDGETLKWWLKLDNSSRAEISESGAGLEDALWGFSTFVSKIANEDNVCVWGNGSDFDNVILSESFSKFGALYKPWNFRNNRCYRTVKNLCPDIPYIHEGVKHNALDDAISQAKHLMKCLKKLGV